MEQMRFETAPLEKLNGLWANWMNKAKHKMSSYIFLLSNGLEFASAAATSAALQLNETAFEVYNLTAETLYNFDWQPMKATLDEHWGRLAQMNPVLYMYPLTLFFWAFLIYYYAPPRYGRDLDEDEKYGLETMEITIYTRDRNHRMYRSPTPPKSGHRMVRRSMKSRSFYELE